LRDHAPDVRDRGAVLAAIGTGDLPYARELAARLRIDFPLLVDPRLRSYGVAGTRRASPLRVLDPRQAVAAALHLVGDRVRQGRTGPHPFQLGATHIMLPSGDVPFAWVNTDFSDNAPPAEVIAALDG
jgi:peroxiredoxin